MNLLILEPPYSHLFKELAKELKPANTFVHIFNIAYLIYLPNLRFVLISQKLRKITPRPESLKKVSSIRSLANSNIKTPEENELKMMASYMEYLTDFLKKNSITHIICHNDLRWQHAIAKEVARENKVSIFFSEEGLFRPHTLTFDMKGVNAYSSVPRNAEFYNENQFKKIETFKPLAKKQLKRALRLFYFVNFIILNNLGDILKLNVSLKNKNYSLKQYFKLFISKLKIANSPAKKTNLSKKFIFVPLQVSTDTQTIIHSEFSGTQQVIDLVEKSYQAIPQALQSEFALVFKQHPMESHIQYKYRDFSIVSDEGTGSLLSKCSLVVLVNSTTIVEALKKHKNIITLGESHYNISGLINKSDGMTLAKDIETSLRLNKSPNFELINSFLNYLKYHYQVNGNIFYYDKNTIKQIKSRIHA